MKIVDCIWEQANLGCRVTEIAVDPTETIQDETLDELEEKYDYLVLKCPVSCFQNYEIAQKKQYTFIEAQISVQKNWKDWIFNPQDARMAKNFSAVEITSTTELEEILSKIDESMYTTDRICLDPAFGPAFSANRYRNWTRSAFEQGAILQKYFFRDKEIGYGVAKLEGQILHGLIGGIYSRSGIGLGFIVPIGVRFIENRSIEWFKTKISANNTPVLRLYNHFNFEITDVEYVFIKHIKH